MLVILLPHLLSTIYKEFLLGLVFPIFGHLHFVPLIVSLDFVTRPPPHILYVCHYSQRFRRRDDDDV